MGILVLYISKVNIFYYVLGFMFRYIKEVECRGR